MDVAPSNQPPFEDLPIIAKKYFGSHVGAGNEHDVYMDKRSNRERVLKVVISNGHFGFCSGESYVFDQDRNKELGMAILPATYSQYLNGLKLMNELFVAGYRVAGKTSTGRLVISQPFLKGKHPAKEELQKYLIECGFAHIEGIKWYHPGMKIVLADGHNGNFLKTLHTTKAGRNIERMNIIDGAIGHLTSGARDWLTRRISQP